MKLKINLDDENRTVEISNLNKKELINLLNDKEIYFTKATQYWCNADEQKDLSKQETTVHDIFVVIQLEL